MNERARRSRLSRASSLHVVGKLRDRDSGRFLRGEHDKGERSARALEVAEEMIARAEAEGLSPLQWLARESTEVR